MFNKMYNKVIIKILVKTGLYFYNNINYKDYLRVIKML